MTFPEVHSLHSPSTFTPLLLSHLSYGRHTSLQVDVATVEESVSKYNKLVFKMERGLVPNKVGG